MLLNALNVAYCRVLHKKPSSGKISTQLFGEDVNLGKCVGRETLKVDVFPEDMWRCISSGKMSTTVELRVFPEEAIFPNCCCIKIEEFFPEELS